MLLNFCIDLFTNDVHVGYFTDQQLQLIEFAQ